MNTRLDKIKNSSFIKYLKAGLSSKYFPFLTAAVTLLCYYLGLDILLIYYISITGILILLLLDDITPFISVMLFLGIMISYKNSPSGIMGNSDYYFRTANLVQIFTILSLYVLAVCYRIVKTVVKKQFKFNAPFYGMCAFAATLLLNGLLSENYTPKNLLYGLIMAASFLVIFCLIKDNVRLDKAAYEKIAYAFLAFSIVLLTELLIAYLTADKIDENGIADRSELTFGWGIWNTMGMWLVMCIPAIIYLATVKKFGFVFTVYSIILCIGVFLTNSRQAMAGAAIVYVLSLVMLFIKGRYRIINGCIVGAALVAGVVLFIIYRDTCLKFITDTVNDFITAGAFYGNTRLLLWRQAFNNYRSAPLLGAGFYVKFTYRANSGLGFMPYMCHNTILQILSCCGTVGFITYAIHRAQTVICYCRNITVERTFIAITVLSLLVISLFDNHIFNIFPTIVYSCLTAVLLNHKEATKE